jgi:hypothetical protein
VGFTVQLPLHEEVALLFEVEVAVGAHEALRVPVLIPRLHHRTTVAKKRSSSEKQLKVRHKRKR